MIEFPKKLEELLLRYIKSTFYPKTKREAQRDKPFDGRDLKFFSKGVAELSRTFTSGRTRLRSDYLNRPPLRSGYLLYFLPINYAKAAWVFFQLPSTFWSRNTFRVLDLGCGPATASLAFLTAVQQKCPEAPLEFQLVDQNKAILRDAQQLLNSWSSELKLTRPPKIETFSRELRRHRLQGKFDLIVLNHVLNEMLQTTALDRGQWLLAKVLPFLKPNGLLVVLEPALKRPNRELMALRDHLLEPGQHRVLGPCLHENICPMLAATKNDWCHFYMDWEEPPYLKQLDRLIHNDNRFLKLAYLILGPKGGYQKNLKQKDKPFRVVSNRMATRGKTEMVLCGKPGRLKISRLDRDRSKKNSALDKTKRGDLVELPGFTGSEFKVEASLRLLSGMEFKKVSE